MKHERPTWMWDEKISTGVNYGAVEEARRYDEMHQRFRDYEKGAETIVTRLGLGPESTVIDMGAGTGAFAVHAAKYCKQIYAVDVSEAMLEVCQSKLTQAGLENVVCRVGGFLSYEHQDEPVEAMVSMAVLHHLPDHWKQVGLNRAAQMIKPGGQLFLFDIVFPSDPRNLAEDIDAPGLHPFAIVPVMNWRKKQKYTFARNSAPMIGSWKVCLNVPDSKLTRPNTTRAFKPRTYAPGHERFESRRNSSFVIVKTGHIPQMGDVFLPNLL